MGGGPSAPLWVDLKAGGNPNYDLFGYVPPGMPKPPQYHWFQFARQGYPQSGFLSEPSSDPKTGYQIRAPLFAVGQTNDILNAWGQSGQVQFESHETMATDGELGTQAVNYFPVYPGEVSGGIYQPSSVDVDPTTYPTGSLQNMRDAAPTRQVWDNWWANVFPSASQSFPVNIPMGATSKAENAMDIYVNAIGTGVTAYANGEFADVTETNSGDTSAYNPCANANALERVIPAGFGFASLYVLNNFSDQLTNALPEGSVSILYATTFFGMFFISKGGVDVASVNSPPGSVAQDADAAAKVLGTGVGAIIGTYAGDAGATIGALIGLASSSMWDTPIKTAIGGAIPLLFLPVWLASLIEKWICQAGNGHLSACDDFGDESGFPDARRWDVMSLASMLTDRVCEQEGWDRKSQQAQYVFRGLATNPKFMEAASIDPSQDSMYDESGKPVNPLGLLIQLYESGQASWYHPKTGANTQRQEWTFEENSFTGVDNSETWGATNQNRFACQNFNLLFDADECSDEQGNKENCPAAGSDPFQRDKIFAQNMKAWIAALVESAKDPNNFYRQYEIPGLLSDKPPPARPYYSCKVYLSTCFLDFDGTADSTGFDQINQRGDYALQYVARDDFNGCSGEEQTKIVANGFMASGCETMEQAWAAVVKNFNLRNQIATAHYWYLDYEAGTMGYKQSASFKKWENGYQGVLDFRKAHPFAEPFAPIGETSSTPLSLPWAFKPLEPRTMQPWTPSTHLNPRTLTPLGAPDSLNFPLHGLIPKLTPWSAPQPLQGATVKTVLYEVTAAIGNKDFALASQIVKATGFPDAQGNSIWGNTTNDNLAYAAGGDAAAIVVDRSAGWAYYQLVETYLLMLIPNNVARADALHDLAVLLVEEWQELYAALTPAEQAYIQLHWMDFTYERPPQ